MFKTRTTCRACGSASLTPILSLGEQRLASNFATSPDYPPVERKIPLELVRCNPQLDEGACGLVQLRHTVNPDLMYASYGYRSGMNKTMTEHLCGIAREVQERVGRAGSGWSGYRLCAVDVGANDGTLLMAYTGDAKLIGYEPSDIRPLGKHNIEYVPDYFNNDFYDQVNALTSIAMFYDLEDPKSFVKNVRDVLTEDGLWVLELSYLPTMLKRCSFDTICHEHVAYYSLSTLEPLFATADMVAIDASLNECNGGSIRITVAKRGSEHARSVSKEARARLYNLRRREFEAKLDTDEPYYAFASCTHRIREQLRQLLLDLVDRGKKVYGYGASTKGNVILQYCNIDDYLVTAIADRNAAKVGGRTVGTDIPIVSEEAMRAARPDYLLVLPWHFLPEFFEREQALLEGGTRFIVPLPEPKIL